MSKEPISDILNDVIIALEHITKTLKELDNRIWKLENE